MEIRAQIDNLIEHEFNRQLELFNYSKQTIIELGEVIEMIFASNMFLQGNSILPVLELIISKLAAREYTKDKADNDPISYYKLFEAAKEYHVLRDYIYYSYADESSIEWKLDNGVIGIRVLDKSIFRQLIHSMQSLMINSSKLFDKDIMRMDELLLCLKGKDEFDLTNPEIMKVLDSIEKEAAIKIESYFSYIPCDSKISFGKYTYSDFITVYKELLMNALYRRYYSYSNELPGVIIFDSRELNDIMSEALNLDKDKSMMILKDISYSSRGTFNYIKQDSLFIMYTTCFSLLDGITNMLKYFAFHHPGAFLASFADPIGQALVDEIEEAFLSYENFRCIKDKKLNKYSQRLPDIDLLALSYEPSLGFHVFVCELKNVLLPVWARDYIKSTGENGYITKAITQLDKINEFLNTEDGYNMLSEIVLEAFSFLDVQKLFPRGFCILIDYAIVTSENIGVLCNDNHINIVSASILKEIVDKSDGDVNYIKYCLTQLDKTMDSCLKILEQKTLIDGVNVRYEVCSSDKLLSFGEHTYISDGTYKELEKAALEAGYSYIDELARE